MTLAAISSKNFIGHKISFKNIMGSSMQSINVLVQNTNSILHVRERFSHATIPHMLLCYCRREQNSVILVTQKKKSVFFPTCDNVIKLTSTDIKYAQVDLRSTHFLSKNMPLSPNDQEISQNHSPSPFFLHLK